MRKYHCYQCLYLPGGSVLLNVRDDALVVYVEAQLTLTVAPQRHVLRLTRNSLHVFRQTPNNSHVLKLTTTKLHGVIFTAHSLNPRRPTQTFHVLHLTQNLLCPSSNTKPITFPVSNTKPKTIIYKYVLLFPVW